MFSVRFSVPFVRASIRKVKTALTAEIHTVRNSSNHVTIDTSRLIMRSLNQYSRPELLKNYHEVLKNPLNVEFFTGKEPWSSSAVENFIDTQTKRWELGSTFGTFAVHLHDSQYIGSLNHYYLENAFPDVMRGDHYVVEVSCFIDHLFWGQGYGTEMLMASKMYMEQFSTEASQRQYIIEKGKPKPVPTEMAGIVQLDNKRSIKMLERVVNEKDDFVFFKNHFNGKSAILFFCKLSKNVSNIDRNFEERLKPK